MTHRPKLSLAANAEVHKKAVPGFGPEPADGEATAAEAVVEASAPAAGAPAEPPPHGVLGANTAPSPTKRPAKGDGGRRMLKILLVATAAVLAVYLLKRRFI